jgi:acyl carrier protein
MTDEIRARLTTLIESIARGSRKEAVQEAFVLLGSEGLFDSVAALRLVVAIEKEFGIVVADEDVNPENLGTMERLERYISRKLNP